MLGSMCVSVGYILGLGDRHVMNILIDCRTAELIHIDLGKTKEGGVSALSVVFFSVGSSALSVAVFFSMGSSALSFVFFSVVFTLSVGISMGSQLCL